MNKLPIGILLLIAALVPGCANNRCQQQVEQSLLLEENRRLYDALYTTHAQLEDLQHENDELRSAADAAARRSYDEDEPYRNSSPRSRYRDDEPRDDGGEAPGFGLPTTTIPDNAPGTTAPPSLLNDGARRSRPASRLPAPGATVQVSAATPGEFNLPEFPEEDSETAFPAWSPTR